MKFPLDKVIYSTPPSPVVLVSTLNNEGRKNVAAFAFFMACAHNPPMIAIGVRKILHTYKYAKELGEFVVGIPTPEIVKGVWLSGDDEKGDDEFKHCGLTPVPSKKVKPFRIKECQVNLECKMKGEFKTTDHTVIFGEVIEADCDEGLYDENKSKFRSNLDTLYHVTGNKFKSGDGEEMEVK
jgi:flavin reductase (DIM6/NTAB) family NADH-FMN oxidoreductase RutF